jgi:hypothetical protein
MKNKTTSRYPVKSCSSLLLLGTTGLIQLHAADADINAAAAAWQKPAWLTDFSVAAKESYDDNILGVADKDPGMSKQDSWITTISPRLGVNFAPLLGKQNILKTVSFNYTPDFNFFHNAPSESNNAHRIGNTVRGKAGDFSFALDNAFLFVDGSSVAPTYAFDQTGPAADQADKFRSNYAHGMARERREQIQDRAAITLQYDIRSFFFRPVASLLYYDMMTDLHNSSKAPYKGYQNYPDRADVNGGFDLGYKLTSDIAVTAGYRHGYQYQGSFAPTIDSATVNGRQMESSSDYDRFLVGIEGKPWKWLTIRLQGGPDWRNYNSGAPVNDYHPMKYYGEASLAATLTPRQTLAFAYKQWQWVSSSGKVPVWESSYTLNYHWNATDKLGLDLGGKIQNADYTSGNAITGSATSLRNDILYTISTGVSYAFTKHFSASLAYSYDFGRNLQDDLPANLYASYRQFDHQLVSISGQYKF